MIYEKHIKQIENLLNKEKIIKHELLQVSFNIACLKFEILNNQKYIVKFFIEGNNKFNAIKSETDNLTYLNKKFKFFPNVIKSNNDFLIMNYLSIIVLIPFFLVLVMTISTIVISKRESLSELNNSLGNIDSIENIKIN